MLATRAEVNFDDHNEIRCWSAAAPINVSDQKEYIAYEATNCRRSGNAGSELFDDIVFKSSTVRTFSGLIPTLQLSGGERVLEMGAGQALASVLLKRAYPTCYIVASDMVPAALEFTNNYEKLLDSFLDEKWAFNCRDVPFQDNQFDRIFTFSAFHHFGIRNDFGGSLAEMVRILKPGGKIFLLYEPSSPKYLYRLIYEIVNRRRNHDGVDEDVLIPSKITNTSNELGCVSKIDYYTNYRNRDSMLSYLYYSTLTVLKFLQSFTVCTVNVLIEKRPP